MERFPKILLLSAIIFFIYFQVSCSENLDPRYENIIPKCQTCTTLNNFSSQRCGDQTTGTFYRDNKIVKFCERSCIKQNTYLNAQIYEFANDADAMAYLKNESLQISSWKDWQISTIDTPNSMITSKTNECYNVKTHGETPKVSPSKSNWHIYEAITFRMNKYVGKYNIHIIFDDIAEYTSWTSKQNGFNIGKEYSNDFYSAINYSINQLRTIQ